MYIYMSYSGRQLDRAFSVLAFSKFLQLGGGVVVVLFCGFFLANGNAFI